MQNGNVELSPGAGKVTPLSVGLLPQPRAPLLGDILGAWIRVSKGPSSAGLGWGLPSASCELLTFCVWARHPLGVEDRRGRWCSLLRKPGLKVRAVSGGVWEERAGLAQGAKAESRRPRIHPRGQGS